MPDLTEKTLSSTRAFDGRLLKLDVVKIELPDGRRSTREIVRHGNAVGILCRRPDGRFILVEQYRKAAEEALVEIVAGGLEPGETPEEGARRETAEETGYDVKSIRFLTTTICTPGYCEERIHLFYAELTEKPHAQDQDPDENVYVKEYTESELDDAIRAGRVFDSKTLAAWVCWKLTSH